MWGRFFAFAMLILIILVIIQFSTLSDDDVAKLKATIEEQQKDKRNSEKPEPASEQSQQSERAAISSSADDEPLLSEPPIMAYESFLDKVHEMESYDELQLYMTPNAIDEHKKHFSALTQDTFAAFKLVHDLQAMEYMGLEYTGSDSAAFSFIASSGFFREMGQVVSSDETTETLELFTVVMIKQAAQWIIEKEYTVPIVNSGFGDLPEAAQYKPLLEMYYTKRKARAE